MQIHLKHVLVVAQTKGFEHDSISAAMAAVYTMGKESGLWDTEMRTDTELLTKKDLGRNAKNLNYFDVLVFASTTGELDMDASQKADMLSFIKEDGKGFVGIHAALDTNYKWPEYGEMIGGWFDEHPWMTFNAPIINEDQDFPAVRHLPKSFVKYDEIYQPKAWSRGNVNVLLSLDSSRLDYANNPRVHRADRDFRSSLDQDVRQRPCLLLHTRPHHGIVGRSRCPQDVFRSHQVDPGHDGRQHGLAPRSAGNARRTLRVSRSLKVGALQKTRIAILSFDSVRIATDITNGKLVQQARTLIA